MTDSDKSDDATSSSRLRRAWPLALLLVAALYVGVGYFFGGEDALEAFASAVPGYLLGAVGLQLGVALTWPLVHRASLRSVDADIGYGHALQVSMSSFTVSHTVPGGGAVGAAVAVDRLNRFGIPGPTATASATLTGVVSLVTIALLGSGGIVTAVFLGDLPRSVLSPMGGALVALSGLTWATLAGLRSAEAGDRVIRAVGRLHPRLRRRTGAWSEAWRAVAEHAPTSRQLAVVMGWSALKWSADVASLALVFLAFDQTPRLSMLLAAIGASQLLAAIPTTPGSVGLVEGGLIGVFSAFGVPLGTGTAITLTYRVIEAWLPTLAGVPVLLRSPERA